MIIPPLFFSCSEEKLTPQSILQKSISYHDPNGNWNNFNNTIMLRSEFASKPEQLSIGLNNPLKKVVYENSNGNIKVDFSDTTCKVISGNRSCESVSWTKNFYHFILGLPMTLNTPDAKLGDSYISESFEGKQCYRIKVNFEQEQWHFYFDTINYKLNGFAFYKNFEKKAEKINTEGIAPIDGIKFIKKRTWWVTTDTLNPEFAGTDEILNSSNN